MLIFKPHLRRSFLVILLLAISTMGFSQQLINISGTVSDRSDGSSLPGVSVKVKNSSIASVTDGNGRFAFKGLDAFATLIFSYVSFKTQEVHLNGKTTLSVKLEPDQKALDEIIVIGYGTTTRQDITTSVSKIDPKKIPTAANNSIPDLLFGRAAGVQVSQQSSQPGGNINISIRGKGTPLIVVDGVVFPKSGLEPDNGSIELQGVNRGSLAGLNPNDIESIEMLKDASAAIYGVDAANGVMLITTKKGKAGSMNITYDGNRSFVSNMDYLTPLNPKDYMTYFDQLAYDKFLSDKNMVPFGTVAPNLTGYARKFSDADIASAGAGTNWLDQVLRNGSIDNHNLAISGGAENITYYFSGNYFNQLGSMKASDLRRYTGRMNLSFQVNKVIKLNASVNANRNGYTNPQAGWQEGGSGTQGFNALQAALAYPSTVPVYDANGKYTLFGNTGNPLSLLNIRDKTEFQGMLSNFSADFDIIPNALSAKLMYGNNNEYSVRDFYVPTDVFYGQLYKSRAALSQARRQNQTMEATLSYKKSFNNIFKLDAVAGVGRYLDNTSGFNVETSDLQDAINTENLGTATGPKTIGSYVNQTQKRSFFFRGSFDLMNKYLLTLSYRYDGLDIFFPDHKYQHFPTASAAWKISNEKFFENLKFINLFKIRGSYGTTGSSPSSTVAYGVYGPDATAITFNNGSTVYIPYRINGFDNPNLRWPITKTMNLGLDFGLFNDRISGSAELFREDQTRLVQNAATAQLSIISTAPVNGGHQRRTGAEFSLNTINIQNKNFTWNTTLNFTNFKVRWIERFPFDPLPRGGVITDPIGTIYVYQTNGILQQGQTIPAWQPNGAKKPGSPLFVDRDNNQVLDDQDIVKYSSVPKAVIGFGNTFTYKKFDLSVFLYGQYGAYGYDYTTAWGDPLNLLTSRQSGTNRVKDAWSTSNPSGTLPGAAYNEASVTGLNAGIDTRLTKTDFLRCRNITLSYTFDNAFTQRFARNLRVFTDIQNAFIITGFKGVDPELQTISRQGGPAPYPMARTISLGVKANF